MKRSAFFTFTVKTICCAFLFGIVPIGCEKPQTDDEIKAEDQYIVPTQKEQAEKQKEVEENTVALEPDPPK